MNKILIGLCAVILLTTFAGLGCAKKAVSGEEAIAHAETLKTKDVQMVYLVGQAERFIERDQYQDALTVAEYIQKNIEPDSRVAVRIEQRARLKLSRQGE